MADVPLITWQADFIAARYSIDELVQSVRRAPAGSSAGALAAVHLAEALERARRDRLAMRFVSVVTNPVGFAAGTTLRAASTIDAAEPVQRRLVRRAHRVASVRAQAGGFEDLHVLARCYLLAGKPNAARRYALLAAYAAATHRAELTEPQPRAFWARVKTDGLANALVASAESVAEQVAELVDPSYAHLTQREVWARQEGAALVTAGRASLQLGDIDETRSLASAALDRRNTMGHALLASVLPVGSFSARWDLLRDIELRDRRYYYGAGHGDLWTAGEAVEHQADRAGRLVKRLL